MPAQTGPDYYGVPFEPVYTPPPRDAAAVAEDPYGVPLEPAPKARPKPIATGTFPATPAIKPAMVMPAAPVFMGLSANTLLLLGGAVLVLWLLSKK
jgi:hypothetical protein